MSYALQMAIVTLLVLFAVVFATWRLMSATLRLRTVEALLRALPPAGTESPAGLRGWLGSLAAKQRAATGCSACGRNPGVNP
jgi:hypothetical protein